MRIISGDCRGRPLKPVPGRGTRPTSDKVKESIFNIIGPYFAEGTVLDLFAGTGALGIEALSRGVRRAVFVDADAKSVHTVKMNLELAGLQRQGEVYRNDAARALKALSRKKASFSLVFLDPPYKMTNMDDTMRVLDEQNLLCPGAVVVVEHSASTAYPEQVGRLRQTRKAVYGDTAVSIYVFSAPEADQASVEEE